MFRLAFRLAIACSILLSIAPPARATSNLNLSKSNINREFPKSQIVSGVTTLSGPSQSQVVYTTPSNADFILTQFCSSKVSGGVRLSASGFGGVAQTGNELCYSFAPGMSLPRASAISCATTAAASPGDYFCTISGALNPDAILP